MPSPVIVWKAGAAEGYPPAPFVPPNAIHAGVFETLRLLGLDGDRVRSLIRPGETVFIKPNMIAEKHKLCDDWEYVITHGSVIRAIVDYVFLALGGKGRILIGDAPQTDSKWDLIVERMGLNALREAYRRERNFDIELLDLRNEFWVEKDGVYVDKVRLPGDPLGGVAFDLASRSMFAEWDGQGKKYYGAFYDVDETNRRHGNGKHEYAVSKSALSADVFISIPKLKTHKKCGLTVNLKGMVGINANKNWLPHYVIGSPAEGGDQFDRAQAAGRLENALVLRAKNLLLRRNRLAQFLARKGKKLAYRMFGDTEEVVRSGNWHGNDTTWRMCLDLNRILMFGNPDGTFRAADSPRRFLSIVDGIVAMEGNGPVAGTPKPAGVLVAGTNPVAVDAVCARLMGFDSEKIPLLRRAFDPHDWPLIDAPYDRIAVASNQPGWNKPLTAWQNADTLRFEPHFGWKGHIELEP